MKKYSSKEQIIGSKRHNSIYLKTGAYILEYSPPVQTNFPGEGNQRDGESCMPLLGTYYIHSYILLQKSCLYPSIFPSSFSIFLKFYHPCILIALLHSQSSKCRILCENMGKKIKENNTSGQGKKSKSIKLYTTLFKNWVY